MSGYLSVIPVALVLQPAPVANLILSAIVVIAGLAAYGKTRKDIPVYIAGSFLLFGLSSFATILGAPDAMAIPLIAIQVFGYILILWVIYLSVKGQARE